MASIKTKPSGINSIAQQRSASRQEYSRVVFALASGEDTGKIDLQSLLFVTGKSFDQLEADVHIVQQRRKAWEQLQEVPALKAQEQAAAEELAQVIAESQELSREFKAKIEPLLERQKQLQATREQASLQAIDVRARSERELRQTADPAIKAEADRLQREEFTRLMQAANKLQAGLNDWTPQRQRRLDELSQRAAALFPEEDRELAMLREWRDRVAEVRRLKAEAAEVQQRIDEQSRRQLDWDAVEFFGEDRP